jgi:hypothetical protein
MTLRTSAEFPAGLREISLSERRTTPHPLGKAGPAWTTLKETPHRECAPLQEEWAFASFALGEKARGAAREAGPPPNVLSLIAIRKGGTTPPNARWSCPDHQFVSSSGN